VIRVFERQCMPKRRAEIASSVGQATIRFAGTTNRCPHCD
jgi:hypothetical protein